MAERKKSSSSRRKTGTTSSSTAKRSTTRSDTTEREPSRASAPESAEQGADPLAFYANPSPPVEFFARGVGIDVAWLGGGTLRCTGNSFATPHLSGICALVLAKHPELRPFQLKSVLSLIATNAGGPDE